MIHSATATLITQPASISNALLSLSSGPTARIHGAWVNACVPVPAAAAQARDELKTPPGRSTGSR
jgi:hypothetical protein